MSVDSDRPTAPYRGGQPEPAANHGTTAGPFNPSEPRFQVERELGRGGMGTVECVRDTATGTRLALKRLRLSGLPERSARQLLHHFEQEFHVLSQLEHPRIIRVHDYGTDSLGPYYTMEVLEGHDLTQLAPLPFRQVCAIGRDVASSLAMLHSRGFVHRDITPRNIRCSENGQAKLLDFGAMCPMGVPPNVVGTPAFVPPEAAQRGALDGRADLYALGACLYYALTRRHAYPARKLVDLPDRWRSPVVPPQQLAPQTPAALNDLILEMLSQNPNGRPQSAAAVFERLVAIGELPRLEELEVGSAYLASPKLVGREPELLTCRRLLLRSMAGAGRSLLITAGAGMGRSRLMDRVLLEGKMMSALVVRADASEANEPFGLLRRLLEGIREARPDWTPDDQALRWLLGDGNAAAPARDQVLEAFRTCVRRHLGHTKLVIAVDDVHLIDEPSLAGIASLASDLHATHTLLVTTAESEFEPQAEAAMGLLQTCSRTLTLAPLKDADVDELLSSVFGAAHNLDLLKVVVQRHASGNPEGIMRTAQALVKAQAIRYAAGAWVVPATIADLEAGIPRDPSMGERFLQLAGDERDLAMALALDVHRQVTRDQQQALLGWDDRSRVLRATDALVAKHILERSGSGQALMPVAHARTIAELPVPERCAPIHERLAEHYRTHGQAGIELYHRTQARDWQRAEALVLAPGSAGAPDPMRHEPTAIDSIQRIIAQRASATPSSPVLLRLRCRLVTLCSALEDWSPIAHHGPLALTALADRCGLSDLCERTAPSDGPDEARLREAIERAEARHREDLTRHGLPEDAGLSLSDALHQLPTVLLAVAATATLAVDPDLAASMPSVAPLAPLSGAFGLVERLRVAIVEMVQGDVTACLHAVRSVHAELLAGLEGLSESGARSLEHFVLGFLQGIEISIAAPEVLERIERTRKRSAKRAERELYAYYTAIGDGEMATAARRRLERLEVEAGAHRHFPTCWESEYSMHSLTYNVEGLRRCEQEAERVARDLHRWAPRVELARLCRAQCGTTSEETLEQAKALFASLGPGSTRRYALYLVCHGLLDLGHYQEARDLIHAEIDALGRRPAWHEGYALTLAVAEAHLGLHEQAAAHVDEHLETYAAAGVGGLLRGRAHEYAARCALLAGDNERFKTHAALCAQFYRNGFNAALSRRYDALMRQARERQVAVSGDLAQAAQYEARTSVSQLCDMLKTELSTIIDPPTRLQHALSLLLKRLSAPAGVLYLAGEQGLRRVAQVGQWPDAAVVDRHAATYWNYETHLDGDLTVTVTDVQAETTQLSCFEADGLRVYLRVLVDDGCEHACGVVAVLGTTADALSMDREALVATTHLLLQEAGVRAVSLV